MLFSLDVLNAEEGDCLILAHGSLAAPRLVLIDGGPGRIWERTLRPRLDALRAAFGIAAREPLPLELVVVSHIDDDHIAGVLKLVEAVDDARTRHQPPPVRIERLWHNSFDDVVPDLDLNAAVALLQQRPDAGGAVAGTRQSRSLRDKAQALGIRVNIKPGKPVLRWEDAPDVVQLFGDLRLTVLGPTQTEIDAYKKRWDKELKAQQAGRVAGVGPDTSEFNLSSITLLAEVGERRMLLTGDASGELVLEGLKAAGRMPADGSPLKVDVFKLPHHGSIRNLKGELLQGVIADTYILSANGKHDNPDLESLEKLAEARGDAPYTVVCTFPESAYADVTGSSEGDRRRYAALKRAHGWLSGRPPGNPTVTYRARDQHGVVLDLGDEHLPA